MCMRHDMSHAHASIEFMDFIQGEMKMRHTSQLSHPVLLDLPGEQGAGILAEWLFETGFTSLRRIDRAGSRELVIWGLLGLSRSPDSGLVRARMLNEPDEPAYRARHEKWLGRISACDPHLGELAGAFCGWQVRLALQRYGAAGSAAAMALRSRLEEVFAGRATGSSWRAAFVGWLLDPAAARLARLAYGPDFTVAEYNRIVCALPLAARVSEEFHSLLPVLGWVLTVQAVSPKNPRIVRALFGEDEITNEAFFYGLRRALLRNYGEGQGENGGYVHIDPSDDQGTMEIQENASPLDAAGNLPCLDSADTDTIKGRFTASGWKLLVRLPRRAVRALFEPRVAKLPAKLQALEFFAATGTRSVPSAAIKAYARKQTFHNLTTGFPRWVRLTGIFLHEIENRMKTGRPLRPLLEEEFVSIADWLSADGITRGHPSRNVSWATLLRRQRAWHQDPCISSKADRNAAWNSPVEKFSVSGCDVTPLVSVSQLIEEGRQMKHCAGGYWRTCLGGQSRLFSLASPGGRSTLELTRRDGSWDIAQLRGPENALPPAIHEKVAAEVLRRCREMILVVPKLDLS